ncbi:hypothetical protein LguiB_019892 [Lonicera macranthoides]
MDEALEVSNMNDWAMSIRFLKALVRRHLPLDSFTEDERRYNGRVGSCAHRSRLMVALHSNIFYYNNLYFRHTALQNATQAYNAALVALPPHLWLRLSRCLAVAPNQYIRAFAPFHAHYPHHDLGAVAAQQALVALVVGEGAMAVYINQLGH